MSKRPKNFVHQDDMDWRESSFGDKYAFKGKSFTMPSGALALGCGLFVQPPGKRAFPQHYHLANEEAVYVLKGQGVVVYTDREVPIRAGDYISFPVGADHAHQIWNNSDEDLEYLCLSTMKEPDIAIYPETGKMGVFAGAAPGQNPKDMTYFKFFYPQDCAYWDGEDQEEFIRPPFRYRPLQTGRGRRRRQGHHIARFSSPTGRQKARSGQGTGLPE